MQIYHFCFHGWFKWENKQLAGSMSSKERKPVDMINRDLVNSIKDHKNVTMLT